MVLAALETVAIEIADGSSDWVTTSEAFDIEDEDEDIELDDAEEDN